MLEAIHNTTADAKLWIGHRGQLSNGDGKCTGAQPFGSQDSGNGLSSAAAGQPPLSSPMHQSNSRSRHETFASSQKYRGTRTTGAGVQVPFLISQQSAPTWTSGASSESLQIASAGDGSQYFVLIWLGSPLSSLPLTDDCRNPDCSLSCAKATP